MTTPAKTAPRPTPGESSIRLTALPDPPQIPDMATQLPDIARALYTLEDYYRAWGNVAVMGNCYLRQDGGDARRAPYPDLLVGFDMPLDPAEIVAANGYSIGEIGKPPDFVLEVASQSTGQRDYTEKREIYARYLVGEYWRFDRTGGQFHDAALAGDRLLPNGEYESIPTYRMDDGVVRGYSPALGLELRWVSGTLRFWDPATREYLPDLAEAKAQRNAEAVARRLAETQRDAEAVARRLAETQREAAEERVRQLEAELHRLRAGN